MRRILASLVPVFLVAVGALACSDDDGGSGSGLDLDAGGFDGFVPPVPVDGGPDAPTTGRPVKVQIVGAAAARKDVLVVFEYADGTLEKQTTGADGIATSGAAAAPVKATALLQRGTTPAPLTWLGVAEGDVLQARAPGAATAAYGSWGLRLPDDAFEERAEATTLCPSSADGLTLDLLAGCAQDDGKATVLAKGLGGGGEVTGFAFQKDLVMPGVVDAVTEVVFDALLPADTLHAIVANRPQGANGDLTALEIYKQRGFNDVVLDLADAVDVSVPAGFATSHQLALSVSAGRQQRMVITSSPPDATKTVSVDHSRLPAALGEFAVGDPRTGTISWTGATAESTAGVARFTFPLTRGATTWTFVLPPGTASVTLPALPGDVTGLALRPDEGADSYPLQAYELFFMKAPAAVTATTLRAKIAAFGLAAGELPHLPMPSDGEYLVNAITSATTH